MNATEQNSQREIVRARYGAIAEQALENSAGCGCNSGGCCGGGPEENYGEALGYSAEQLAAAPAGANLNLGCGNPLAFAGLRSGDTVLDLGSGAGFDCFVAARELGGTGRVIGVDMTPAMITKARHNAARSGHDNVEFRLGEIEALPVADSSVDLVISNCVINLSPDKPRVIREAFRVLKSGGRVSISDVVARQPLPVEWREDADRLTGCVSGAETIDSLQRWLAETGFVDVRITPREESRKFIDSWIDGKSLGEFVVSAIIEARKP